MTQKFAVIGHPIGQSKSPLIHGYWIKQNGLIANYGALDIAPNSFEYELRELVERHGYSGFNITIPYKERAMALCDELDDSAKTIGAVNTIHAKGGRLIGYNTDSIGFLENLKHETGTDHFAGTAVVLGAGGAARGVIDALLKAGFEHITLTNRTREKADELQDMAPGKIKVVSWDERAQALAGADLLVNTTSLGMAGQPPLELNLANLPTSAIVCDIVYKPLMTDLLHAAKKQGNKTVTGIGMLLYQAQEAFEIWTGIHPAVSEELKIKVLS